MDQTQTSKVNVSTSAPENLCIAWVFPVVEHMTNLWRF